MKVLYTRVSTIQQNLDRQRVNSDEFDLVLEDKCSGGIPFFERPSGRLVKEYVEKGSLSRLYVYAIDRLGRDLRDIINNIEYFTKRNVPIYFVSQGLCTIDEDGRVNPVSKMMISILGVVGEMERSQIRERQLEGIAIAKAKGNVYQGRRPGAVEDVLKFLSKDKNARAYKLLLKGYKGVEVAKIVGIHVNTITKIKKIIREQARKESSC